MLSFSIWSEFANFELMRDVRREPHSPSYPHAIRMRSCQRHRSLEGVRAGMAVYFLLLLRLCAKKKMWGI